MRRCTLQLVALLVLAPYFLVAQSFCDIDSNLGLPDSLDVGCNACTTLTAEFPELNAPTTYTVESIADATLPYPLNQGTVTISTTDDIWSALIPMGFDFCFFGQTYSSIVLGSNGLLTFNAFSANGGCPWAFTQQIPSAALPTNSIFGIYQDIYPATCGNIRYAIYGEAPCRTFVINYQNVCMFSCTNLQSSSQIVLHESTNVVEVYVVNRPFCAWNSGSALIGLQNQGGTVGIAPPGRNTGPWTAGAEAWRFVPAGDAGATVNWFENGAFIGEGQSIEVCPDSASTYNAALTYDICSSPLAGDGCAFYNINVGSGTFPGEVSWNLLLNGVTVLSGGAPYANSVCLPNGCYTLQMFDSFGDGWNGSTFTISYQGANLATAALPSGSAGTANFCVNAFIPDDEEDPDVIIEGDIVATVFIDVLLDDLDPGLVAPEPVCTDVELLLLSAVEPNGVWDATCSTCIDQNGQLDLTGLSAGQYLVFYTVEGACGPIVDSVTVNVSTPPSLSLNGPLALCDFSSPVSFSATPQGGVWSADCDGCVSSFGVFDPFGLTAGSYTLSYLLEGVCTVDESIDVAIEPTLTSALTTPEPLCESESITLLADNGGGFWAADCGNCVNAQTGLFSGSASGAGTFIVVYDFDALCTEPTSIEVEVSPSVDASLGIVPQLCETGASIVISAAQPGGVWSADCEGCLSGNGVFDPQISGAGEYVVTYSIEGVCSDEDVVAVEVLDQRDASFDIAALLCIDAGFYIPDALQGGGVWTAECAGCIDSVSGEIDLAMAGQSHLMVTYTFDGVCSATSSETACLVACEIELPNIFSPNNDGVNDALVFENLSFCSNSHLIVQNRWGNVVFEDLNYNNSNNWGGADLPSGTYYFILTMADVKVYAGPVTLVR
jgi:gliding motility-associated-like protein